MHIVVAGCDKPPAASEKGDEKEADSGIHLSADEMKGLGIVTQPFKHGNWMLETPPFAHPDSWWAFRLMAFYNRRLASMALSRRRRGVWGRHNDRRYFGFISYEFNKRLPFRVIGLVFLWLRLELTEGWRSWFSSSSSVPVSELTPAAEPVKV